MSTKKDTQEGTLVEVSKLDVTKLKEFATGEQGQYIKLVDIEDTKSKLQELAKRYEGLVITKENYKKEGALAEKTLRQSRYALQRIHKGNNKFINDVKKKEKELYDELIALIEPQEKRIYNEVLAFKELAKKEKEEAERKERERVAKIEKALKEAEFSLEKAIIKGKTDADLEEYDKFLEELKENFKDFEEMEFQAKRLHAIYTARRSELVKQIEEFKKLEAEKKEAEKKAKEREEKINKIFALRKKTLLSKGLKGTGLQFEGYGLTLPTDEVKALDEVGWLELVEQIDASIKEFEIAKLEAEKKAKEAEEKAKKEELLKARKDWDELLVIYEGLGGDAKLWKLRKNQIPSADEVNKLAQATKDLQAQKRTLKIESVKNDITPYKNELEAYVSGLRAKIEEEKSKFKNSESVTILNSFVAKLDELIKESFNEV